VRLCAFMICIIVSYGTTVYFHGRCGLRGLFDLYIFFLYSCINVYVFYVDAGLRFEREPVYLYDFSLLFIQSNSVLSSSPSTACSLSRDSIYR
jgi:hypothetical protein